MVAVFWLKLDTWPRSVILDLLFIARHPRQVLPTSFTGNITSKLGGDDWGQGWAETRLKRLAEIKPKGIIKLVEILTCLHHWISTDPGLVQFGMEGHLSSTLQQRTYHCQLCGHKEQLYFLKQAKGIQYG